jgi:hypothetical protein
MPFIVERLRHNGHPRVRIRCTAANNSVHSRCYLGKQGAYCMHSLEFKKCNIDLNVAICFIDKHRYDDEPNAYDILLALLPEKHKSITRRMWLACERRLLGEEK